MATVHRGEEAGFETAYLTDSATGAVVTVVPERGGMVTGFDVGETRVLYLDKATLQDRSKNVRGGIPVLFPTPGKLRDDRWAYGGHAGTLTQHGFARDRAWRCISELGGALAVLALRLEGGGDARWPWRFTFDLTYTLQGDTLRIHQRVSNEGSEPMPFGVGFHPYFHVAEADKAQTRVETTATRAFDNVAKRTLTLDGPVDLTATEVDLHLLDHPGHSCTLALPGRRVVVRGSPHFTQWVVWTLRGRDFVCLEPWTGPGDALNSGDRLRVVAPGESASMFVEIAHSR